MKIIDLYIPHIESNTNSLEFIYTYVVLENVVTAWQNCTQEAKKIIRSIFLSISLRVLIIKMVFSTAAVTCIIRLVKYTPARP